MTLIEFLRARINERESAITYAHETGNLSFPILSPAEMLADLEAKRRIVERALANGMGQAPLASALNDWPLRHLAAVYADHPDYREEWKP